MFADEFPAPAVTFNRTIVELKPLPIMLEPSPVPAFNRTIVELKHSRWEGYDNRAPPFNRTIVELKLAILVVLFITYSVLLIEPLWN